MNKPTLCCKANTVFAVVFAPPPVQRTVYIPPKRVV